MMRKFFVWLAGHDPAGVVRDHRDDVFDVAVLGGPVLLASLLAAMSWGVAGYTLAPSPGEWVVAVLAGVLGLCVVLIIDRKMLYLTDTTRWGWWGTLVFLGARLGITLLIGSLTAGAILPFFLRHELEVKALEMVESREKVRSAELGLRLALDDKRSAVEGATALAKDLGDSLHQLPAAVEVLKARADRCWQAHGRLMRETSAATGELDADAAERHQQAVRESARRCQAAQREADNAKVSYETDVRSRLAQAQAAKSQAESALTTAADERSRRVDTARKMETDALNPASATVMAELLATDRGAFVKWLTLTALLVLLELLPLLLKTMRGRTLVGQRIIEQRAARRQALAAQTDAAGLEGEIACGLAGASRKGLQDALNSADMVQHFASTFAAQMKAVAPLDAVVVMAREIARRETEVQEHMLSHPSHALVPQAWAVAMKQAASALHGSFASPQVAPT